MDALTAAKARIDRALNELERKLQDLKEKSAASSLADGDLFAPDPAQAANAERLAELEAASQQAATALAAAAEVVRGILEQPAPETISEPSDISDMESR